MFFGGDFPFEGMGGGGGMPGGMPGGRKGPSGPIDNKEFYELLGVGKEATESEIKRAYKKGALKHHPDKGGDPEMVRSIVYYLPKWWSCIAAGEFSLLRVKHAYILLPN